MFLIKLIYLKMEYEMSKYFCANYRYTYAILCLYIHLCMDLFICINVSIGLPGL